MTPHSPKSWTLDGSSSATCLGEAHKQPHVRIFRTSILETGRPSFLSPCSSKIQVKEMFAHGYSALDTTDSTQTLNGENLGQSVFLHTANDNKLAPSMDDLRFLQITGDAYRQESCRQSLVDTRQKIWSHPFLSSPHENNCPTTGSTPKAASTLSTAL